MIVSASNGESMSALIGDQRPSNFNSPSPRTWRRNPSPGEDGPTRFAEAHASLKAPLASLVVGILAALTHCEAASADPCKAIPDKGPMPAYLGSGSQFSGPVAYVGDGDSLCVALGSGPASWVEVRLADFYAPELNEPGGRLAKSTLEQIAVGRMASCVAGHRSHDRVVARCTLGGRSIGDLMRARGVREGGNGR